MISRNNLSPVLQPLSEEEGEHVAEVRQNRELLERDDQKPGEALTVREELPGLFFFSPRADADAATIEDSRQQQRHGAQGRYISMI